jgi:cysteine-rich repeat protein
VYTPYVEIDDQDRLHLVMPPVGGPMTYSIWDYQTNTWTTENVPFNPPQSFSFGNAFFIQPDGSILLFTSTGSVRVKSKSGGTWTDLPGYALDFVGGFAAARRADGVIEIFYEDDKAPAGADTHNLYRVTFDPATLVWGTREFIQVVSANNERQLFAPANGNLYFTYCRMSDSTYLDPLTLIQRLATPQLLVTGAGGYAVRPALTQVDPSHFTAAFTLPATASYHLELTAADAARNLSVDSEWLGQAVCGDALVAPPEGCDNGAANSNTTPNACRTTCVLPWCGDSVTDSGEACDNGAANSNTTPNACRLNCALPRCGDGVTDSGEVCDDGNLNDLDACKNNCTLPVCPVGQDLERENLMFDLFEADMSLWTVVGTVTNNNTGKYHGNKGADLEKTGSMTTTLSTLNHSAVQIGYWLRVNNYDAGEWAIVSYCTSNCGVAQSWVVLDTVVGTTNWTYYGHTLPASADNLATLKIKIESNSNGSAERALIEDFLVTAARCTTAIPPLSTMFQDDFEQGNLVAEGWTTSGNASTTAASLYDGALGAHLKGASGLASITRTLNTTGRTNVVLEYYRMTDQTATNELLNVQWSTDGVNYTTLESVRSNIWAYSTFALPPAANNQPALRIRFSLLANATGDRAYIDNVRIQASQP